MLSKWLLKFVSVLTSLNASGLKKLISKTKLKNFILAVKFGRMTKCQRELLLDQAESYRHEMEKKQKEAKFDQNSAGEYSDSNSSQNSPQERVNLF